MITDWEYYKLKAQLAILQHVAIDYPTCSIDNIISQISARVKTFEKTNI